MSTKTSRRTFISTTIKAGLTIPFLSSGLLSCYSSPANKLNILILGGTSFLGPHQIAYALERGHSVSIFTRGKTKPTIHKALFDQVEQLVGDRNDNLKALENRKWDAVIDNSGRQVEWTRKTAELLKDNCGIYLYTSSTGVYYPYINSEFKESSKVVDAIPENITADQKPDYDYGVMKTNSEQEAITHFGANRTIVVRPTYMVGPADRTNRFMHWPLRLSQGGETLVPGKENDQVQYMDVRDVADWMIRLIEDKKSGIFNAVGPRGSQTMYSFINNAKEAFDKPTKIIQIDDYDFLIENNIYYMIPWVMPTGNYAGTSKINNSKAIENGLTFRPLKETILDIYNWWHSDAVSRDRRNKFMSDPNSVLNREKEILEKWKVR